MTISNNLSVSLLNSLYQGNMALHANRMDRKLYPMPGNKAGSSGALLGSENARYVSSLRTSADSLTNVLRQLSGVASSNRIVAMSSNPGAVSIQHTGTKPSGVAPMEVKIIRIASGQANEGSNMNAKAAFDGNAGANRISIEAGGKTTQISVDVKTGDTNKDVQQKMADAINKSGAGVRATVETDTETNMSTLKLESTTTGSDANKSGFTIKDVTGDLIAKTGADAVARGGQDAIFSVDGGPARTSQSNNVYIGNGVTATLNKASEETAKITWGRETSVTKSYVEDLVKSYNNLYSVAAEKTDDMRAQNLALKMVNISKTYSNTLSNIGLGFDSSGRMTINSEKMNKAAESGKLDQFFTENRGKSYGFTNQLGRLADSISRNPGNFVSSSMFGGGMMGNSGYTGFGSATQFNFYSPGSLMDFML